MQCGVVFILYVENIEECVGWKECERYVKAPLHHYPLAPQPRHQQQRHPNIYITDNTWPRVLGSTPHTNHRPSGLRPD